MNGIYQRVAKIGIGKLFGTHPSGSQEWLKDRRGAVGGSDIGVICGKSPYKSALTLWAQRTHRIDEDSVNAAMLIGTVLESSIIALYALEHPDMIVHEKAHTWAMNTDERLRANPDAFIENEFGDTAILEIKYTRQHWKELPEHYRYQVIWYQTVTGLHNDATVAALTADGYQEFTVQFDAELSKHMITKAIEFLQCVENDIQPNWDGSESSYQTVRALHPEIVDEEKQISARSYLQLTNAIDMQEFWTQQVTLRKMQVMNELNGARWGYVDNEQVVSLRARGEGKPYLHINGR